MWVHSVLVLSNGIGESLEHLRQLLLILRGPLVQNLPVDLASGVPHGLWINPRLIAKLTVGRRTVLFPSALHVRLNRLTDLTWPPGVDEGVSR